MKEIPSNAKIPGNDYSVLQKLESESEVAQFCLTLCKPHGLYVAYQTPPSMEFSRQEYWSGFPFLPPSK